MSPLPHWDTIPDDVGAAIITWKTAIHECFAQLGTSAEEVVGGLETAMRAEVREIVELGAAGESVFPTVEFADVVADAVTDAQRDLIRRRGCVVIRSNFDAEQAVDWDRALLDYVESNGFFEAFSGEPDAFFGSLAQSRPEIFPIYWSPSQMDARQHPNMQRAQRFLNSLWTSHSEGRQWFDPDRNLVYPDRVRRRPPGTTSAGLSNHHDAGAIDLWLSGSYQHVFRQLWAGEPLRHDPWDASHRTEAGRYAGSRMCSAFRTFQGWTALSSMQRDQGVLHTVPITNAISYLMMRPLLDDVEPTDLCGVHHNRAFPANERWHSWLLEGRVGIPDVEPGDTVWWHCDMIHSVAPVADQLGWGNVMYIPAAPWCTANAEYAGAVRHSLETGESPYDFPADHYERQWPDRFTIADLNEIGRAGIGL